jgi:hypothetical protein
MKVSQSNSERIKFSAVLDESDVRALLVQLFGDDIFESEDWSISISPYRFTKGELGDITLFIEAIVLRKRAS